MSYFALLAAVILFVLAFAGALLSELRVAIRSRDRIGCLMLGCALGVLLITVGTFLAYLIGLSA